MPLGFGRSILSKPIVAAAGRTALTVTAYGDAQIDTAIKKFGTGAGLFDDTGDYLIVGDWNTAGENTVPQSGEFTVECWVYLSSSYGGSTNEVFFGQYGPYSVSNPAGRQQLSVISDQLRWFFNGSSTVLIQDTVSFPKDQWVHVAATRDSSNDCRLFKDGSQVGSTVNNTQDATNGATFIGAFGNGTVVSDPWLGSIDEFRISNVARYTSTFTPSTSAFTNDADTLLLLHMDGTDGSTTFTDDNS